MTYDRWEIGEWYKTSGGYEAQVLGRGGGVWRDLIISGKIKVGDKEESVTWCSDGSVFSKETPHKYDLIPPVEQRITNINVPKNEAEWWRITKLPACAKKTRGCGRRWSRLRIWRTSLTICSMVKNFGRIATCLIATSLMQCRQSGISAPPAPLFVREGIMRDIIEKLREYAQYSETQSERNTFETSIKEITHLREENARLREALEQSVNEMRPMLRSMISRDEAVKIIKRAAAAAIREGKKDV